MESYCIYLRKSRADAQTEGGEEETLSRHRAALLELANRLKLKIDTIYAEIVSGETLDARPVARKLLDEVGRGLWSGVLVTEIERLARGDTADQGAVARAFSLGHAKVITPGRIYDPDNEQDEEYFEFGLFMSRREYKVINRRIQRGRAASAREGKFLGSIPPFGYDKIKIHNGKGYALSPNSHAQEVETIFKLFVSGLGVTQIARRLDELCIEPPGGDKWSASTLYGILKNPVYTGLLRWGYRLDKKHLENGIIIKRRKKSAAPILVTGLHPALIDSGLFEAARLLREKRTRPKTKCGLELKNPFSGILLCCLCGRPMSRLGPGTQNGPAYLCCKTPGCENVSAPLFLIEKELVRALSERFSGYELEYSGVADKNPETEMINRALSAANNEEAELIKQFSNLHDFLERGIYTPEDFKSRRAELRARLESMHIRISELIKASPGSRAPTSEELPRGLFDAYFQLSPAMKNRLLRLLLARVLYIKRKKNQKGASGNPNFELSVFPRLPCPREQKKQ